VLLFAVHHIASDGWSSGVFTRSSAPSIEPSSPAPVAARRTADPVRRSRRLAQRRCMAGAALEQRLAYWRGHLGGARLRARSPGRSPAPAGPSHPRRSPARSPSPRRSPGPSPISLARRGTTLIHDALLAAFDVSLYRYAGQGRSRRRHPDRRGAPGAETGG
jgi:hypothetical protein